jgi:hypothetical protein
MAVKSTVNAAEAAEETKATNTATEAGKAADGANSSATDTKETLTLVYIGPTLPAGQLKSNKIMVGTLDEIKEDLKTVLEKYPLVEKMLVPVEQLAAKKDKAKTAGNVLNKYYSDIVSMIAANEAKEG